MSEGKTAKTSPKKLETNERYLQKLDRITFRIKKDGSDGITKESLERVAAENGESLNAYIIRVLNENMPCTRK